MTTAIKPAIKDGEGPVFDERLPSHLWAIHGEYYDFTPFLSRHPGGEEMLLLGRGRDCSEMFESVHALSAISVHSMLTKYRVEKPKDAPRAPESLFSWDENGFYATLKSRVRQHFKSQNNNHKMNYKANWVYWVKLPILLAVYFYIVTTSLTSPSLSLGLRLLTALAGGIVMQMLTLNILHDGSHYAVSKRPWINRVMHTFWSNWVLWSHFIWLRHHVYGHHSYTGVLHRDPDIINISSFARKHPKTDYQPWYKFQTATGLVFLAGFPGQHLGQVSLYIQSWLARCLCDIHLEEMSRLDIILSLAIYTPSLIGQFLLPFYFFWHAPLVALLLIVAYWSGVGLSYFCSVAPNHDSVKTHENIHAIQLIESRNATSSATQQLHKYGTVDKSGVYRRDWGIQQVASSGNHSTTATRQDQTTTSGDVYTYTRNICSTIVTHLWGGMNYQIEHHLFPSVSHVHYPAIAPIVERTCAEFQVAYVTHSWLTALVEFSELLTWLSNKKPTPTPRQPLYQASDEGGQKGE